MLRARAHVQRRSRKARYGEGLGVGDILEYAGALPHGKPQVPGQFWYQYSFFKSTSSKDEELEISVPRDKYVKVKSPDYPRNQRRRRAQDLYLEDFESDAQGPRGIRWNESESPPPSVQLTTFRDWAEVGSWYEELQRPQMAVTPRSRPKLPS